MTPESTPRTPLTQLTHPSGATLQQLSAGQLAEPARQEVSTHVVSCVLCTERLRVSRSASEPTPEIVLQALPTELAPPMQRGSLLGRYVVLDVLGAGGMGEVYTAIDPELDRRVALKLVRAESGRGADAQTRLLREAQAMAKLSHPNVVEVYDVGVVDGRVFLAMELISGSTVAQWSKAKPRSWQEIVAVYREAGKGLAAAHQAGMVHRDFKPDNVLVGADGRVHVSDFGLARSSSAEPEASAPASGAITDGPVNLLSSQMTHAATVLGTPAYMAPEQFDGEPANAKSDQFALCVSLYRSLYDQTPFLNETLVGLVKAVKAGELRAPPASAQVPAWVHRVLVKGLSTSPSQRYASIDELLDALTKDPAIRRNRWLLRGAVTAVVGLAIAGGLFALQRHNERCTGADAALVGIWDEPRQQAIAAAFQKTGIAYADDVWRTVRAALDQYAHDWVTQRTAACEATWRTHQQSDAVLTLRMRCLGDRLDELHSLTNVLMQADANTVKAAPKAPGSLTELDRCADISALERRMPLPKNADDQRKIEALQHRLNDTASSIAVGRYQEGLAQVETIAAQAAELHYAPLQADASHWLIRLNGRLGHWAVIRDLIFETVRLAELAGDDSLRFDATVSLASLGLELGEPLEQMFAYCELAENMLPRIKDNAGLAVKLETVRGNAYLTRGNAVEAVAAYQRGIAIGEASPHDLSSQVLDLYDNVALAHHLQHHDYQARDEHLKVSAMIIKRLGSRHPDIAFTDVNLTGVYLALNDPSQGLPLIDQALSVRLESLGHDHSLTAETFQNRGTVLSRMGRMAEAEHDLLEAKAIADKVAPEAPISHQTLIALGEFALLNNTPADALRWFDQAIALSAKLELEEVSPQLLGQGLALVALHRYAEGEAKLTAALPVLTKESNIVGLHRAHFALAEAAWQRSDKRAARAFAEQARDDLATVEGNTIDRQANVRKWLAEHPLP